VGSSNEYRVYALGLASRQGRGGGDTSGRSLRTRERLEKSAGVTSPAISQRSSIRCASTRFCVPDHAAVQGQSGVQYQPVSEI
jgi:hypothetical protein